jgi:hypothetical protein
MPNGSHRVRGGHDVDFVRSALKLEWREGTATLTAHDVGHRVPTGDVFRHLVLWADDVPLARFGLELNSGEDAAGNPGVQVKKDTRLVPDVPVRVTVPLAARVVRLTYHFTAPSPRARPLLTREDQLVELFSIEWSRPSPVTPVWRAVPRPEVRAPSNQPVGTPSATGLLRSASVPSVQRAAQQ